MYITEEEVVSFQVSVIYDKVLAGSHICRLDKGFQINLHENYNEEIKRGTLMKKLIENVGDNVKTFKYSG